MASSILFAFFWPFDGSFGGACVIFLLFIVWLIHSTIAAAEKTAEVAKKVVQSDAVQEASAGFVNAWWNSQFKK